jgi:hypothetical protein
MDSAIVHEDDNVSGMLITYASLTDFGDGNFFEPGREYGAINKALGL